GPARGASGRAPRLPPLRRTDAEARRALGVPQDEGRADGDPLPGAHAPAAGRRAAEAACAAAHRAAREGDPHAADLGRPHGDRDRHGGDGGPRVLRSLMADVPLRILEIYPKGDFFTGAAMQLRDLACGLATRGHHITVVTPPSETWASRCRDAGLAHVAIPMRRQWDPRAAWRLARLIRAERIQVVHAHKGRARPLTLLAGLMGARALLVLNRGVSFKIGRLRRVGYTSRRVHAVVAVCRSIKDGLIASGVPAEKVEVIYSGTDLERYHPGADGGPVRRELGLTGEHALITQIGVRSWRGWRDLLEAMATVAQHLSRARLLFVGA